MSRHFFHTGRLGRRDLMLRGGAGALGAAALGMMPRPAHAATTMTWMGWQGYETPVKHGDFLAKNNIDFQPTFVASNEEIITKLQQGGLGKTDLITMYFGYLPLMSEADMLEPIDTSKITNLGDLVPQFVSQQAIRHDGQLMGVPWNWGSLPLMYDPAVIATAPTSWTDVLKDEYKGKVAMVDDPLSWLMIWGRVLTDAEEGTILTKPQMKSVIDYLIDMKKNHARAFFPSYGDMADAFARNEVVISASGWEAVAIWAAGKGKTIAYTIPQEGTGMFMDCLCIPKGAPNQELSYAMINHIISPEPQKVFGVEQAAGVANTKALPLMPPEYFTTYGPAYQDMDGFLGKARLFPVPPQESTGDIATYDEFLEEYQRLQKA